ncbi:MAG: DnaD domain protein [Anaerolineales bacterium]
MQKFPGFSTSQPTLPIPAELITRLLPSLPADELRLLLTLLYRLSDPQTLHLTQYQIQTDPLVQNLFEGDTPQARGIPQILTALVNRGILLADIAGADGESGTRYFLNAPKGRAALAALQNTPAQPAPENIPNLYRLYEENIGPLTPLLAETLQEAEQTYPPEDLRAAIQIAVEKNKRSWRYIQAILERWKIEGRNDRTPRQDPPKTRGYTEGPFAEYINRD